MTGPPPVARPGIWGRGHAAQEEGPVGAPQGFDRRRGGKEFQGAGSGSSGGDQWSVSAVIPSRGDPE